MVPVVGYKPSPPQINGVVKAVENKGRNFTKIGNLDTIWEQQKDRVTVTDIVNIADIADTTSCQMKYQSNVKYPLNSTALSMLRAFNEVRFQ